ncbi:oxygen-dependent protoporphyrinogen oxidase [Arcanobacterium pluranimalium]|uniref:protoporphyrinogen/coproporphyrinogen oxidase n=1 Tax=Arcanobacterium pluranimalium TaxID=108028 RepID=UPI00195D435B|nr:FAD-dependent oxidoreductase [Arcanobacterium pluranimalium]MBM7825179.1 oxygen-dependent protoporphyrinogen oxidase [Arcanobacterium pluranimalium]
MHDTAVIHNTVIIGGGIAGLTTAYALAKRGIISTVVEARTSLGGLAAGGTIAGARFDLGAESFTVRSTKILELCAELGLEVRDPAGSSWVWDDDGASPIAHGIWGIPSSWDDPALSVLSLAELDEARQLDGADPTFGAQAHSLAQLVRVRLGEAALRKLVAPVAGAIHGSSPDELDLDAVAPGLRAALLSKGSLIAAVHVLRAEEKSSIAQPVGGINALVTALIDRLTTLGVSILTGYMAIDIAREDSLSSEDAKFGILLARSDGDKKNPRPYPGTEEAIFAKRLVMALDGPHALPLVLPLVDLLNGHNDSNDGSSRDNGGESHDDRNNNSRDNGHSSYTVQPDIAHWEITQGAPITTVILALNDEKLDAAPLGSGVLVRPGSTLPVKALTHYSVKWPWAGEALTRLHGSHSHLVRLSYGRPGESIPEPTIDQALRDASALFGFTITPHALIEGRIIEWGPALIAHSPEHKQNVEFLMQNVQKVPGLYLTGAWIAGTGLGSVIPHAYEIGESID